jgi:anion-transporting  ArsA/GET3 family ATPase
MGLAAEKTPDFLNNDIEDKIEPIKPELPVVRHENLEWLEKTKEELDKMAGELFKQKEKDPGKTVEFEKKLF